MTHDKTGQQEWYRGRNVVAHGAENRYINNHDFGEE